MILIVPSNACDTLLSHSLLSALFSFWLHGLYSCQLSCFVALLCEQSDRKRDGGRLYVRHERGREKSGEGKIAAADYRRQNDHLVSLTSAMTERHNIVVNSMRKITPITT
ncbi:transmembrane protein, putative [Medicago truncatula]|uniref:Transmembrane protein, putative n=1 Tax=Medicago truncatula TaxID=3880 RepID=A0A072UCD7_MEDTR|nr:transmembrane protein, putative [Medicago truncatula]